MKARDNMIGMVAAIEGGKLCNAALDKLGSTELAVVALQTAYYGALFAVISNAPKDQQQALIDRIKAHEAIAYELTRKLCADTDTKVYC